MILQFIKWCVKYAEWLLVAVFLILIIEVTWVMNII